MAEAKTPKQAVPEPAPIAKVYDDEINFNTAAEIVGIQGNYFRKLVRDGRVPGAKKNSQGFWKFSRSEIEAWAGNRTRRSPSDGRTTYRIRLNDVEAALVREALADTGLELKPAYNRKKKAASPAAE